MNLTISFDLIYCMYFELFLLMFRSKFLSDDWMEENGFIEPNLQGISKKFW